MKKGFFVLFLSLSVLGLAACSRIGSEQARSEEVDIPQMPDSGVSATKNEAESDVYIFPSEQASDWQKAFYEKLCTVRKEKAAGNVDDGVNYIESYFIYDIDQNGTPELFIRFGNCEAAYETHVFIFEDNKLNDLGAIAGGHSSFYSIPDEGLMVYWGHMCSEFVQKATLVDGEFKFETLSEREFMDDVDGDYTPAEQLIPGAKSIIECRENLDLPVMMYGKSNFSTATGLSEEDVKAVLTKAYQENGDVYAVSGDGYGGDAGRISFDELCKPGVLEDNMDNAALVAEEQWVDLNQDGQTECVLKMQSGEGTEPIYVMLSLQNDTVYAYSFHYWSSDVTFHEDGTFDYEYSYYNRVIFDLDQCYPTEE